MIIKIRILTCILTLFILLLSSCSKAPVKVACVGNSITYGSGIENRVEDSYPAQLQELLGTKYDVWNFGYSGRTLLKKGDFPYWDEVHLKAVKAINPDIVIIKLGTNDTKPQNWEYADEFETDYKKLIEEFSNLPSHPDIWLCYPVPAFATRWGIRDSVIVHAIIPILDNISSELNLPLIDLYHPFLGKGALFPDDIHPDKDGAGIMAEIIAGMIMDEKQ
ncbi:MAG: hypothetical protein JSV24_08135 [Bacteroidales bacterium]|nr:MAG: hypothetical protein JSV24_08135 [Bacteroidales bacterium]